MTQTTTENANRRSFLNPEDIDAALKGLVNSRNTLMLSFLFCLGAGVVAGFAKGPMFSATLQIEVHTGSSDVSPKQRILLANSTLTNPTIAKSVIDELNLMESNITEEVDREELLDKLIKRYGDRLSVRNIPSSDVFDITITNKLRDRVRDILRQHFIEYINYEQIKSDQVYKRLRDVLNEVIENSYDNLSKQKLELSKFAIANNVVDLELDDRDLVEFNGFEKPTAPSTLPPSVQTSLDVLKRIYIQDRSQYFSYVQQRRKLDFDYQSATPAAIVLSEPSYPEKSYPSVLKFGLVGIFLGSFICFTLVVFFAYRSYREHKN